MQIYRDERNQPPPPSTEEPPKGPVLIGLKHITTNILLFLMAFPT